MFGSKKIVNLTPERRIDYLHHLHRALEHQEIEPLMKPYVSHIEKYLWVATSSCCDGHDPWYNAYVYIHVAEEQVYALEEMLMSLCDNFGGDEVYAKKTVEYRYGTPTVRYILHMPTQSINEVMSELLVQLDIINDTLFQ